MIGTDEDALICDLAETYKIYSYESLPLPLVATFSVGLRNDSRIKMKMNDMKTPLNSLLLASIADSLKLLVWAKTEDGRRNINKPNSIVSMIIGEEEQKEVMSFNTPNEFEEARRKILERGE